MVGRLSPSGRAAWLPRVLIGSAVALLHLAVAEHLPIRQTDPGLPPRLQVVYLHELTPVEVPAQRSAQRVERRREPIAPTGEFSPPVSSTVPPAPTPAASQPVLAHVDSPFDRVGSSAAGTASSPDQPLAAGAEPGADDLDAAASSTPVAGDPAVSERLQDHAGPLATAIQTDESAASGSKRPAFEWPVSTRLSYVLGGHYRGEVNGSAQVEWINAAPRYQVNLDVTVGLSFAPLFTRNMRSDGRMVARGLQPEHYAEASRLAFREPRRASLRIDSNGVRDASGRRWPVDALAGSMAVQDSASQFVQLSWLFTVDPELLTRGRLIEFDLALPRRVARWAYEVGEPQTIHTPFGPVEAVHVQPRPGTERGSDLLAQAWFAPSLANLPVRIRIEQAADVWLDLVLERRPEIAAR